MSVTVSQEIALSEDYTPQGRPNYTKLAGEKQLYERGDRFFIRHKLPGGKDKWSELPATTLREARYERDLRVNGQQHRYVQKKAKCDVAFEAILEMRQSPDVRAEDRWSEMTVRSHTRRWYGFCSPIIGKVDVDRVTPDQIQAIYKAMRKLTFTTAGGKERTYAESYISDTQSTLSVFFNTAMADPFNFCVENPVPLVGFFRPTGIETGEVGAWAIIEEDEAERIFAATRNRQNSSLVTEAIFRLAYGTGGRIGEVLGLKWEDELIDLREGSVTFTHQLHKLGKIAGGEADLLRPLKGKKDQVGGAVRNVPLFDDTLAFMRGYREWLISMGLYQRGGWVFPTIPKKTPKLHSATQRAFYAAVEKAGIERKEDQHLHFHCLRHSYASRLFAAGFSLPEVAEYLGHTNPEITRKRYVRIYNLTTRNQSARERMRAAQVR